MKNNKTLNIIALLAFTLFLGACEETSTYNGESLDGVWEVDELLPNENLPSGYLVKVQHDAKDNSILKISNFLDQYEDYDVVDPNYILSATLSGNRISISSQGVGEVIVKLGNGQVNSSNNFKIDYSYFFDGKTYNGSANFVRESK